MYDTTLSKSVQPGWTPFTHPEGQPYYQIRFENILYTTEVDVNNGASYAKILRFITEIRDRIHQYGWERVPDIEAVLEIEKEGEDSTEGEIWTYYMIDHREKHLFWFKKHDISDHPNHLSGGVPSIMHLSMWLSYFLHIMTMISTYVPNDT